MVDSGVALAGCGVHYPENSIWSGTVLYDTMRFIENGHGPFKASYRVGKRFTGALNFSAARGN
jgi:hypothetical protein